MRAKIFNTVFETSLRVILLLSEKSPLTEIQITGIDFITTYAKYFDAGMMNLNGDGHVLLASYSSRQKVMKEAIKKLVVEDFTAPLQTKTGFVYCLTENGVKLAEDLRSEYACNYRTLVKKIPKQVFEMPDHKLIQLITELSKKAVLEREELEE